jgi:hypothetical protein
VDHRTCHAGHPPLCARPNERALWFTSPPNAGSAGRHRGLGLPAAVPKVLPAHINLDGHATQGALDPGRARASAGTARGMDAVRITCHHHCRQVLCRPGPLSLGSPSWPGHRGSRCAGETQPHDDGHEFRATDAGTVGRTR